LGNKKKEDGPKSATQETIAQELRLDLIRYVDNFTNLVRHVVVKKCERTFVLKQPSLRIPRETY